MDLGYRFVQKFPIFTKVSDIQDFTRGVVVAQPTENSIRMAPVQASSIELSDDGLGHVELYHSIFGSLDIIEKNNELQIGKEYHVYAGPIRETIVDGEKSLDVRSLKLTNTSLSLQPTYMLGNEVYTYIMDRVHGSPVGKKIVITDRNRFHRAKKIAKEASVVGIDGLINVLLGNLFG